jgi:branched-chain amino acid transport system substrate-binding protein
MFGIRMRRVARRTLATALLACCGVAHGETPPPLKIGLTAPLTGSHAALGESVRNGARLAVREINHVGGLLGRQIELVERDDQGDADLAARQAGDLMRKDRVVAAIAVAGTAAASNALGRLSGEAPTPIVLAASMAQPITRTGSYLFWMSPSVQAEAVVLCGEMAKLGMNTIAIVADDSPDSDAAVAAVQAAARLSKLRVAVVERIGERAPDLPEALKRARAAGAQALVMWGSGAGAAAVARLRRDMDWLVPLFGGWPASSQRFLDLAGEAAEGTRMTQTFIQDEGASSVKSGFLLAYQSAFRQAAIPSPMAAAQGYDAVYLLAAAMRQAHSAEGRMIRAALENLERKVSGVLTTYDRPFSRDNHEALTAAMLVLGQVKNGRVVHAYPDDGRRATPGRRLSDAR